MTPDKLSASRINTYLTCGMRYFWRYVAGEVIKPSGAMMLGTQFHAGVGFNMKQKIETHADLPTKEVLEYYSASYDLAKKGTLWMPDEDPGKLKDTGVSLLTEYQTVAAPTIQPVHVERHLFIQTPEYEFPFEGYIDCVDENSQLIEMKTTSKTPKQPLFPHQLQGTFYALMFRTLGVDETRVRYDYALKLKTPKVLTFKRKISHKDLLMITTTIDTVLKGIQNEVWLSNARGSWSCTRKWCGYWNLCEHHCGGRIPDK